MEILSNLVWLSVVLALWGFCLSGRRGQGKASLLPAIGVQLVALALLSAVLLPAISVTDDLQTAHNLAEVVRPGSKSDHHLALEQASHPLPVALALLFFSYRPLRLHTFAFLSGDESMPHQAAACARTLWSRPPPAA